MKDVREEAIAGIKAIWAVSENGALVGVMVTAPAQNKRCRWIRLWVVGGKGLDRWGQAAYQFLNAHAKKHDCAFIEGGGRAGWKRGYGEVHDLGPVLFLPVQ